MTHHFHPTVDVHRTDPHFDVDSHLEAQYEDRYHDLDQSDYEADGRAAEIEHECPCDEHDIAAPPPMDRMEISARLVAAANATQCEVCLIHGGHHDNCFARADVELPADDPEFNASLAYADSWEAAEMSGTDQW
jgi:hypothetical protein